MKKVLLFLAALSFPLFLWAAPDYQSVIRYLHPTAVNGEDFGIRDDGSGPYISLWKTATLGEQPTEQQLRDTEALPAYLTWLLTHGGDPVATIKHIAKEAQDANDERARAQRAVVKLTVDEINAIRDAHTKLLEAIAGATSLANLKTRVADTVPNLPQRTYGQAKTAIEAIIDGE